MCQGKELYIKRFSILQNRNNKSLANKINIIIAYKQIIPAMVKPAKTKITNL